MKVQLRVWGGSVVVAPISEPASRRRGMVNVVQYFIGIAPPKADRDRIRDFRGRWRSARHVLTEPHITVKAQGGLSEDLGWVKAVRRVCRTWHSFDVEIRGPHMFGATVVYLSVKSPALPVLHEQILACVPPPADTMQQYFEGEWYVPHLILGQSSWGMTDAELQAMYREADTLSFRGPFTATGLQIFRGLTPGRYEPYIQIPFGYSD
ncbi:2'-5' RNA ligase family protein [Sulfobacillus harzensis]|uniref:2'-5' RNA ligase family protein n=1 Tax=Sulfobacillus harzensis TaxID=2729629 RepID=A0A7Y0L621_9FIRM|nr:2'-5' RNA ligase family protein [Sulfobacillus harzensis]NMP23713.1 2'-5' RNA ligase family protein [Sulfobacillus harzensis]